MVEPFPIPLQSSTLADFSLLLFSLSPSSADSSETTLVPHSCCLAIYSNALYVSLFSFSHATTSCPPPSFLQPLSEAELLHFCNQASRCPYSATSLGKRVHLRPFQALQPLYDATTAWA